jgi:nicotinamide mononucleotide adenylyltransferase
MKIVHSPLGCVHGRFQPPHLEHQEYILEAARRCDHLIVGITQPNIADLSACPEDPHRSDAKNNPLTFDERCIAIRLMLMANAISQDRFSFVQFPIENPTYLANVLPKNAICYTTIRDDWNLNKVSRLEQQGYTVEILWDKRSEKGITGTQIRELAANGNASWKKYLQVDVANYLDQIKFSERLMQLNQKQI